MSRVAPETVPFHTLPTGARMPSIGMGTFGSDKYSACEVAEAVVDAAAVGYRHFDCAAVYRNEREIGQALADVVRSGISRDELWVTSKLWNDKHAPEDVVPAFEESLHNLGLDYLNLYLIHWPFPNHHGPGVDVTSRDPHARPYIHDEYMAIWRKLEGLVRKGLVRHIGTSNMTIPKLNRLLRDAEIRPAANEMELHPHFQQPELFRYVVEEGIVPIGYSPIGSPSRPERDRTADDSVDVEDPVIVSIAERLGVHPAVVCVKWAVQRGQVPIPFSVKRSQYLSTLQAVAGEPLSDAEMEGIAAIDRGCRLIKGQVFLWQAARSWEDLWDIDGVIAV